jgi:hypothetical protein
MTEIERLRDATNRERAGLREAELRMVAEEHELEDGLREFDTDLGKTKRSIEEGLRHEHWEREPVRALAWRARSDMED